MTCTCTHPLDAHVIVPVGKAERIEPCGQSEDGRECACENYQEVDGG